MTSSERYLQRLSRRTFLSLWSHAGIYRDQGQTATSRQGKEVCDLLVVFRDHIIIFSDKDCVFPNTSNLKTDWCRWFKKAILDSAKQVWGAERWIRQFPGRLFLDRACTQPYPFDLPDVGSMNVHRVVVAHGASRRCRERFGASGSLPLASQTVGEMHYADQSAVTPFLVGDVEPKRGFVHIFDDSVLGTVMGELDTVWDFISYLAKRETLIRGGQLLFASGEEDLLARYLTERDTLGYHDFAVSPGHKLYVEEGLWRAYTSSPRYAARVRNLEESYPWDRLIETFSKHILAGTSYDPPEITADSKERAVRFLAAETRVGRRMLAQVLLTFVNSAAPKCVATQVVTRNPPERPFYVLMVCPQRAEETRREYRERRRTLLAAYCLVVKLRFPEAQFVVGLATEPADSNSRSEDLISMDVRYLSPDQRAEAERVQQEYGLLTGGTHEPLNTDGPNARAQEGSVVRPRSNRNAPCPCGSGQKFKRCHGR